MLRWGDPTGAPREPEVPVFPCLVLEDVITIHHLLLGQGVDLQVGVRLHHIQKRLVGGAHLLPVHLLCWPPDDVEGLLGLLEEVRLVPQQQRDAGV